MTSPGEILLLSLALLVALGVVVRTTQGHARLALALAIASGAAAGLFLVPRRAPASPIPSEPGPTAQASYVGSAACRACHPGEHASFGRTYHRTMTARATPETVLAPLERRGERGDEVWATLPDPEGGPGEVTRRVVLTTGSHREQVYWVAGKREGELRLFPQVWLVKDRRLVPRKDAFLVPPEAPAPRVRWNSNCIACHAVAGEPGHDEAKDAFDTRVAELGIACEACHGPGAEHTARHRDPVERYVQHASKRADPTIVQPKRLPPERGAAVCGQCHSYAFPKDEQEWWRAGYARTFRAGDALDPSRILLDPAELGRTVALDAAAESLFWPDGTIRVGGREYNGLVASACYLRGEGERKLTCTACHTMHAGDPSMQLAPDRAGDASCTSCHTMKADHSHHAAGTAPCVSCHMPRTSYALFSAVRSHRIESPRADDAKPDACNLCHLDRSLAWTSQRLSAWYGKKADPSLPAVAEGERGALSGNAAVRVVVADALGRPESAARPAFAAPLLAELLVDPYAAVRFVAGRSLRGLPGYGDVAYDFVAPEADRQRARDEVLARARPSPEDAARLRALLAARDLRAITIAE